MASKELDLNSLRFNDQFNQLKNLPYVRDRFSYQRRKTREVKVGALGIGGTNPIRVQTMTISDTQNVKATVDETERLAKAGCELVRITAPSQKDAECLKEIRAELNRRNCLVPLCADIHFTPKAALLACEYVEKVRINPGNFADKKVFASREYTDQEYEEELERIEVKFRPLVLRAKELGRALRIGTNHGSLSDRIMNRYGDTPLGMVESAMEFIEICRHHGFHDLIISMKASNPKVMIEAYRLLVAKMDQVQYDYPLHLGVTEAGAGEDGRIKSAVGIGTLLEDGLGDTVRVSLTENAIEEVPVVFDLIRRYTPSPADPYFHQSKQDQKTFIPYCGPLPEDRFLEIQKESTFNPYVYERRRASLMEFSEIPFGGEESTRVQIGLSHLDNHGSLEEVKALLGLKSGMDIEELKNQTRTEIIEIPIRDHLAFGLSPIRSFQKELQSKGISLGLTLRIPNGDSSFISLAKSPGDWVTLALSSLKNQSEEDWLQTLQNIIQKIIKQRIGVQWIMDEQGLPAWSKERWGQGPEAYAHLLYLLIRMAKESGLEKQLPGFELKNPVACYRYFRNLLDEGKITIPILVCEPNPCPVTSDDLRSSSVVGNILCDGLGDVLVIQARNRKPEARLRFAYNLLQATGNRISKTEFISCPSCGRTLFDLQETTERIRSKTGHLKGVRLAIMGCIVNGPGEMADAHFGYVGAGPGRINLYVGKECVQKNISSQEADQRLMDLIKDHGMWTEPPKGLINSMGPK